MNVIYSYKRVLQNKKELSANFWNVARLSVSYANRFYNTILYCDTNTKKLFKSNEIPIKEYIIVDEIEKYDGVVYPMPKIYGILEHCKRYPNKPFYHIDLDTVIINKLSEPKQSFAFSHPEINLKERVTPTVIDFLTKAYLEPYDRIKLIEQIGEYDFSFIPNYNIIYIKNTKLGSYYWNKLLDIIESNEVIKSKSLGDILEAGVSQLLEQYTFYHLLKQDKIKVGIYSKMGTFDFFGGYVRLSNDLISLNDITIEQLNKYDYLHLSSYDVFQESTDTVVKILMDELGISNTFTSSKSGLL